MAEESTPSSKCIESEVYNDPFFKLRNSTQTKFVKLRHTWTIHNFNFCCEKLISPTFSARGNQWNDKSEWQLEFYPRGIEGSNYASLYIRLVTSNLNEVQTEYQLGIVNADGQEYNNHNSSKKFVAKEASGYKDFYYNNLLGNKLTFYCEITATVGIENILETLTTPKSDLLKVLHVNKYYENEYDDPIFKSTGSTLIKVVKFRYTWTVNKFGRSCENNGEKLVSPAFSAGKNCWNDKSEWRLWLYPKGEDKKSSEYVSLYLVRNTCRGREIVIKYKLGIVNAHSENIRKIDASYRFTKNGIDIGCKQFIKQNDLYNPKNKFVVDDKLTIFCEITATACSDNTSEILTAPKSDLGKNFAFLLENKYLSDVTLLAGGKEFPAHKVILAARSLVFRNMFQHDMEESRKNLVEITDLDEEGLNEMLCYMYTGEVQKLEQVAPRLLGMAEKYAMDELKLMCEKALFESLSVENAAEMFILSDKFLSTELKNQVKIFIVANAVDVGNTAEFEMMIQTHPHLAKEAFCALSNLSNI